MMDRAIGSVVNVVDRAIIPRPVMHARSDRKFCHVPVDVFVPDSFPISDSVAPLIDQDHHLDYSVYRDVRCRDKVQNFDNMRGAIFCRNGEGELAYLTGSLGAI